MKKIIIIGSKGMAGHVMYQYFKRHATPFEVVDISRDNDFFTSNYTADATDLERLKAIFHAEKPDFVINCIGVLNKDAEDNPDKAIFLNSYFPHFLAREGIKNDFKLIHISTDCVFNGKKGKYTEGSVKDGFGVYAQSKALGEVDYGQHLTVRTSIIGPELKAHGIGLFDWFMQQKGIIKGYRNVIWSGVTTVELAKAVDKMLQQNITGLYHLVNNPINKFDLLGVFKAVFRKKDVEITVFDDYYSDKSLINTRRDFDYAVSDYSIMVQEMSDWINNYPTFYGKYIID